MKWVKFLKDDNGRKAGEVVQIDDAEHGFLLARKTVEDHAEPKEVADAAADVTGVAREAAEGFMAEFRKTFNAEVKSAAKKPAVITTHDNADDDPECGFKSLGEQLSAVHKYVTRGKMDERLDRMDKRAKDVSTKSPTNVASEGIGADGGFGVAPDYSPVLMRHALSDASLLPLCRQFTTTGNTYTYPKDETTPWGTDGVQAYWTGEANQLQDSKPKIGEGNLTLNKLTVLVPVTNELLDDNAINLGNYITQVAPEKIADKINGAIVAGTGAGQPLGILNSGALVVVNKELNQTSGTITTPNVAKMLSGLPAYSLQNATWLYHSTTLPQIIGLTIGQQPVFTPVGGMDKAAFGALFGRPMLPSEQCQALTNQGDLMLIDFSKYMAVLKTAGIQQAVSMHLYFDRDLTAFRFVFRMAGQPWLSAPITQKNGGGKLSPFVTLQAR